MDAITPLNLLVAFAAGTLSFLSPCMLPLVPGYLAVLGGEADVDRTAEARVTRRMRGAGAFVAGFGIVFVVLGLASGAAGSFVVEARRPLEISGGVVIALLGLLMLGERMTPAALQRRIGGELRAPAPGLVGALAFGAVFGAAWSPCIGPTLGAILTLAAAGGSALAGGVLLTAFALGLGVPFILLAAGAGWLERVLGSVRRHAGSIRTASGILLLVFGTALALGLVGRLSSQLAGVPGLDI